MKEKLFKSKSLEELKQTNPVAGTLFVVVLLLGILLSAVTDQFARERQARVILGESEKQIAASFADAALQYANNPTALHLRAMNMLFEGLKEKGALVIVPSSAVDTMNLGGLSGLTALAKNVESAPKSS